MATEISLRIGDDVLGVNVRILGGPASSALMPWLSRNVFALPVTPTDRTRLAEYLAPHALGFASLTNSLKEPALAVCLLSFSALVGVHYRACFPFWVVVEARLDQSSPLPLVY